MNGEINKYKMKKLIVLLVLSVTIFSCTNESYDLNSKGYDYSIIDTTYVSRNGFNGILGYHVIVEQDSSLYSAYMNSDGIITKFDRKLKVRK